MAKVRLIRKLAPLLNGIDLSKHQVGDVISVSDAVALMLVREGWAKWATGDKAAGKSDKAAAESNSADRKARHSEPHPSSHRSKRR